MNSSHTHALSKVRTGTINPKFTSENERPNNAGIVFQLVTTITLSAAAVLLLRINKRNSKTGSTNIFQNHSQYSYNRRAFDRYCRKTTRAAISKRPKSPQSDTCTLLTIVVATLDWANKKKERETRIGYPKARARAGV